MIPLPATTTGPNVIEADVNVYYQGAPQPIPGAPKQYPTRESPAMFTLLPQKAGAFCMARDAFYGLANGDQPLVYPAAITLDSGNQVAIDDQVMQNNYPTIQVSPAQRYFTVEVTPAATGKGGLRVGDRDVDAVWAATPVTVHVEQR